MFFHGSGTWPCLSCRAAEAHALVPVLEGVCRTLHTGSDHDEHRLRALAHLSRMYEIVQHGDAVFLTKFESAGLLEAIEGHLLHINWLLQEAQTAGILKYPLMTKHHVLWHIGDSSKYLSPKATWCYQYEDSIGDLVTSARACLASTPMPRISSKLLQNYMVALELSIRMRYKA